MNTILVLIMILGFIMISYDVAYKRGYKKGSDDTYNNMKKVRVRK